MSPPFVAPSGGGLGKPPPTLCMLIYELYAFNKAKGCESIGVLPERRNNPKRVSTESILNWGQKYFGIHLSLAGMYLIEVKTNVEAIRPGTKELYLCNLMRGRKK